MPKKRERGKKRRVAINYLNTLRQVCPGSNGKIDYLLEAGK